MWWSWIKQWLNSLTQCWAKFLTPTGNFPAAYDPNRKLKFLTGHFPTSDNVNRNMLKKINYHIPKRNSTRWGSNINRVHTFYEANMLSLPYLVRPLHRWGSNIEMVRFFVDIIILVSKSRASIQYHLNNLYGIPCEKGLTVNLGNTKAMNFHASTLTF